MASTARVAANGTGSVPATFARSAASRLLLRLFPAAGLSLILLAGCQAFPKPAGTNPLAIGQPVLPLTTSRGAAPPEDADPDRSLNFKIDVDQGDRRQTADGRSAISASMARSQSPVSTAVESQFHLPARPGAETFFRPGMARGPASPIADAAAVFGSDDGEGTTALIQFNDEIPAPDAGANVFEAEDAAPDLSEPHRISFLEDMRELPSLLWKDNLSLYNWRNAVIMGAAAGGAVAIRDNLDKRVRQETADEPLRWGQGSVVLRQFGEFAYQLPVLTGLYGVSLWFEDDKLHEFSKTALSAYGLSAMYTVAIKGMTDTQRPTTQFQNGHYGFPSYHAASTFCLAAVIDEYYGWQAGVPAYILAGLVGWSRIDQREHDLSDVVFGSILGIVIGKTVAATHLERYSGFQVTPYYDPGTRTTGVTAEKRF